MVGLRFSIRAATTIASIVAIASCGTVQPAESTSRSKLPATVTSTPQHAAAPAAVTDRFGVSAVAPRALAQFAGQAYEVVAAPADATLWVPVFTGKELVLDQWSASGSLLASFDVAATASSGIDSHTKIAPDGSIWVSDDYALYQFDPASQEISTIAIDKDDPNAVPGALTDRVPLPGTWVTAFAFGGNGTLILARNNVPALEVIAAVAPSSSQIRTTIPLPAGIGGVADMTVSADGLQLLPGRPNQEGVTGPVTLPDTATNAAPAVRPSALRSAQLGPTTVLLPNGDWIRSTASGAVHIIEPNGVSVPITLASKATEIGAPNGTIHTVTIRERVLGATLGPTGTIWLLLAALGGGTELATLPTASS